MPYTDRIQELQGEVGTRASKLLAMYRELGDTGGTFSVQDVTVTVSPRQGDQLDSRDVDELLDTISRDADVLVQRGENSMELLLGVLLLRAPGAVLAQIAEDFRDAVVGESEGQSHINLQQ
jgi:hypothetical protein